MLEQTRHESPDCPVRPTSPELRPSSSFATTPSPLPPEDVNGNQQQPVHVAPLLSLHTTELTNPAIPVNDPAIPVSDPAVPVSDPAVPVNNPSVPVNDPAVPANETSSATAHANHSERAPPPAGKFTFDGTQSFIKPATMDYLQTVSAGQRWIDMVVSYLHLEEFPNIKGVSIIILSWCLPLTRINQSPMHLPTSSRPDEVTTWMKTRSYDTQHIPFITDVESYSKTWVAWWTQCQPAWRQSNEWPLPRDIPSSAKWGIKGGARGQNGLFLVVISTAWWASSIQSEEAWVVFDEAVDDIQWVIDQTINALKSLPAPHDASETSVPAPGAAWMARQDGKRQSKPSRRLREGGGIYGHS